MRAENGVNVDRPGGRRARRRRAPRSVRPLQAAPRARCGRARLAGGRQASTSSRTSTSPSPSSVSASDVVRGAAALVGGGGGGRPTMARAGGKDPAKLPDALAEAERLISALRSRGCEGAGARLRRRAHRRRRLGPDAGRSRGRSRSIARAATRRGAAACRRARARARGRARGRRVAADAARRAWRAGARDGGVRRGAPRASSTFRSRRSTSASRPSSRRRPRRRVARTRTPVPPRICSPATSSGAGGAAMSRRRSPLVGIAGRRRSRPPAGWSRGCRTPPAERDVADDRHGDHGRGRPGDACGSSSRRASRAARWLRASRPSVRSRSRSAA